MGVCSGLRGDCCSMYHRQNQMQRVTGCSQWSPLSSFALGFPNPFPAEGSGTETERRTTSKTHPPGDPHPHRLTELLAKLEDKVGATIRQKGTKSRTPIICILMTTKVWLSSATWKEFRGVRQSFCWVVVYQACTPGEGPGYPCV